MALLYVFEACKGNEHPTNFAWPKRGGNDMK